MSTKEQDFKERFIATVQDLESHGRKDAEAMWLVGSFAAGLIDLYRLKSWGEFKRSLPSIAYNKLLRDFEQQGNKYHREKNDKAAYAIQLLATSVVAGTQTDRQVKAGDQLLDQAVDTAVAMYRKAKAGTAAKAS